MTVILLAGSQDGWAQRLTLDPSLERRVDSTALAAPGVEYEVGVGMGTSRIENSQGDAVRYTMFSFMPEVYYGDFGVGFLLNIRARATEGVRQEDFDSAGDILSLLRFVEYGEPGRTGTYVRFGMLEEATLGYGQHIDLYANTLRLDDPERGLRVDVNTGAYRVEGVLGSLADPGVFGIRGSYRPLPEDTVAWRQRLILGASLSGDLSTEGARINASTPGDPFFVGERPFRDQAPAFDLQPGQRDPRLFMVGLDLGLQMVRSREASVIGYVEASKIINYGVGLGVGVEGTRRFDGGHRLQGRVAQHVLGARFLPSYFGPVYEIERLRALRIPLGSGEPIDVLDSKRNVLAGQTGIRWQSHLSGQWHYNRMLRVIGSYEHIWNQPYSGWFHLDARLRSPRLPVYLRFIYDRLNVGAFNELTDVEEENTLVRLGFAYKVIRFALLGFDYRQSFEPRFEEGLLVGRARRQRIEPYVQLILRIQ
ncbi:MAG: hypothetical protein AAGI71_09710 [Bacteroidota bacterium]